MKLLACLFVALIPVSAGATAPSPYAGQESRAIKTLSQSEQADLLAGKGMGLAKAAELNGYPGPAHVLELAEALSLTAEQRSRTLALFAKMEANAQAIGRDIVSAEQALNELFASQTVTPAKLLDSVTSIGALQARLRAVHLEAHIDQTRILTPEQIIAYQRLRGYTNAAEHSGHNHQHMH